ncbi:MAG TPA: alcohol dehydrogenase catalytic domain-containing protein, partial [Microbacterium sp.]|nr:alcohol dehydrogenase catalytic domain-containing protein [Microbacterium sp.]
MRALTIEPGVAGSDRLREVAEPHRDEGSVLVAALALGICGTDREIVSGSYGEAPPGQPHLVLGHESLGRVLEAPDGGGPVAGRSGGRDRAAARSGPVRQLRGRR